MLSDKKMFEPSCQQLVCIVLANQLGLSKKWNFTHLSKGQKETIVNDCKLCFQFCVVCKLNGIGKDFHPLESEDWGERRGVRVKGEGVWGVRGAGERVRGVGVRAENIGV